MVIWADCVAVVNHRKKLAMSIFVSVSVCARLWTGIRFLAVLKEAPRLWFRADLYGCEIGFADPAAAGGRLPEIAGLHSAI